MDGGNAVFFETHDEGKFAEEIGIKVEQRRIWIYELQVLFTHLKPCWAFLQFVGNYINWASPIFLTSEHLEGQLLLKVNKRFWSPQTVDSADNQ